MTTEEEASMDARNGVLASGQTARLFNYQGLLQGYRKGDLTS